MKVFSCVQAQAHSQAQAAARERADVARSPQDAAEAWRRHIYVEGLFAQPMGMSGPLAFTRIHLLIIHNCIQPCCVC